MSLTVSSPPLCCPRSLLATAGSQECDHCGGYLQWDEESEWQDMWQEWEKKLAYYDRSLGKVMDNW